VSREATSPVARAEVRYRFGPHPHGGFILGFRLAQLGGFIAAGVLGIALMSVGGFAAVLLIGVDALLAIGVLVITWHGHTLEEWTPLCVRFLLGRLGGRHRFRSAKPAMGHASRLSGAGGLDPQPVEVPVSLPAEIAELELLEGELPRHGGVSFGVVKDCRAQTYTATLMCQSSAFYLLSAQDREARLAAYGSVLAALARDHGPTRRIAWYERTLPPGSDQLAEYLHEAKRVDADMRDRPVELVSYLELLAGQGDGAEDHEVLVSLQVDAARPVAGRAIRDLGGGDEGALLVVADELDLLAHRLSQAGVVVAGVLNRRGLASAIRNGFDPFGRHVRDTGQQNGRVGGIAAHTAGPLTRDTCWSHVGCDGSLHTTLWIAEWPRIDVRATFLEELLMHTGATRTVALVMELLGPAQGMRKAERAATEAGAERALRARIGKRTSARERQRETAVSTREEELATGHAAVRFAGYVTVSVPNTGPDAASELGMTVRKVEMAANSRQLRLERMWGQQEEALTYTLPLCRGLV
jgi:hypothetical protein